MSIEKLGACGVLGRFCSVGMIVWSPEIEVSCSAGHIFVQQVDFVDLSEGCLTGKQGCLRVSKDV
jgi:hypothetical protein